MRGPSRATTGGASSRPTRSSSWASVLASITPLPARISDRLLSGERDQARAATTSCFWSAHRSRGRTHPGAVRATSCLDRPSRISRLEGRDVGFGSSLHAQSRHDDWPPALNGRAGDSASGVVLARHTVCGMREWSWSGIRGPSSGASVTEDRPGSQSITRGGEEAMASRCPSLGHRRRWRRARARRANSAGSTLIKAGQVSPAPPRRVASGSSHRRRQPRTGGLPSRHRPSGANPRRSGRRRSP